MKLFTTHDEAKDKDIPSVEAIAHHVVEDVGGNVVDIEIANYLADQFKKKHNVFAISMQVDPRDDPKSWTKLLHRSTDAKEILSANK